MSNVDLEIDTSKEQANFAALECHDTRLLETFVVLVLDIVRTLGSRRVTSRDVHEQLARWRDLLTNRIPLSSAEQLGLWGELEMLSRFPLLQPAIDGWHGPKKEAIDFSRNAIGLEIKTATKRRVHQLRWSQAVFGDTPHDTYLASLHVIADPTGRSIPELATTLLDRAEDPYALREKLLAARYHDEHAHQYEERWTLVEEPTFFLMANVPRFTEIPDGIHDVKWKVDLTNKRSLTEAQVERLLRNFVETQ